MWRMLAFDRFRPAIVPRVFTDAYESGSYPHTFGATGLYPQGCCRVVTTLVVVRMMGI